MFQFRPFPSYAYFIQRTILSFELSGFPHSDIPGSMLICSSPRLFAACHVLRRLLMPRHPPCALCRLTSLVLVFSLRIMQALSSTKLKLLPDLTNVFTSMKSFFTFPSVAFACFFFLCSVLKVQKPLSAAAESPDSLKSDTNFHFGENLYPPSKGRILVGPSGLEPPTLRLSVVRSSQLSYGPICNCQAIT